MDNFIMFFYVLFPPFVRDLSLYNQLLVSLSFCLFCFHFLLSIPVATAIAIAILLEVNFTDVEILLCKSASTGLTS